MKLKEISLFLIQVYFVYFFIFLNKWEPYSNIPIGTKGVNIFVAIVLFLGIIYTLFYLNYILNVYVFKKEFGIKIDSKFIYFCFIFLLLISIIIANTTNSFFVKYGDTRETCKQAYATTCQTGALCSIPECKEVNLDYKAGKEITKKYHPVYAIFINEYLTKLTGKLI
ncbi:MAG: hypothetical protein PHF86_09875 [Candidatus Nanoarchaeia archaeon]|nr:hypothetical protein [Candidatus Nanoarchaeia archaeon]